MARPPATGSRIRERRLALGRKQAAVAADAGISPSYLNLIEHNRRAIAGKLLSRLADALDTDRAALAEEGDEDLVAAIRAAAAAGDLSMEAQEEASDLARRHPAWARLVAAQHEALAAQARTIEALSDRLSHDPTLAEAMHELLSTVAVVRSTASILAQTPEIDPNWLGRFHANLDADSRRLAEGAEAVVGLFDQQGTRADDRMLPSEIASRFLDDAAHRFPALEARGASAIPEIVSGIADDDARALVVDILRADAADAARLPAEIVRAADGPDDLLSAAGGDAALVLRRMGVVDPARGLVVSDASGALLRRKPVAGFGLPVMGAGCPLWPIYTSMAQPGRSIATRIETPDGAGWLAHAIALPISGGGAFGAAPILRSTMLLTRADGSGAGDPVGPGCRICSRAACAARREPTILSAADA